LELKLAKPGGLIRLDEFRGGSHTFPLWSWKGWEGFIEEGNAEDIFGVGQSGLWMAVNGYGRMSLPQHSACSAMQAIKICIYSFCQSLLVVSCTQLHLLPVRTVI